MKISNKNIWLAALSFLFFACAKVGSPPGGPKDTKPPVVKKAVPESGSVNFSETYFDIQFDEYVKLNNIQQNLIVSPPFSENPRVKIKGKGIRVILPEKPQENTTYSFTFLDAISDITESNATHSLVYAFSTGPQIDSLRVSGRLEDAFTGDKLPGVYVMLYRADNDSAFRTRPPDYLTMTNQNGEFGFFYLAEGEYRIYALEDANYSYSFDQPNERIAFLDSLIVPHAEIQFDTLDSVSYTSYGPDDLFLQMFEEENKRQYIASSERIMAGDLSFVLAQKNDEDIQWKSPDFGEENVILIKNQDSDSLGFYLKSRDLAEKDSLRLFVTYNSNVDSIGYETDSLVFPLPKEQSHSLILSDNLSHGKLHYFNQPEISVNGLIRSVDTSRIVLYHQLNDSTEKRLPFTLESMKNKLGFRINTSFMEGENYRLMLDSMAVQDVLGRVNDSSSVEFVYRKQSSYSELTLNIKTDDPQFFCELLNGDEVVKQASPDGTGKVSFEYLEPGKYGVRLVFDENQDLKWNPGNLKLSRQPEQTKYYPEKIELRANWQQETDWILND